MEALDAADAAKPEGIADSEDSDEDSDEDSSEDSGKSEEATSDDKE